ncbi:MAG: hypothetical protein KTR14_04605 [Vampirovibrio sp.]|nr:hypothetical protein [Vampirovibrio sp.]
MMMMAHHESEEEGVRDPEATAKWFFHEFWGVILFGSLFVVMVSLPLVLSGVVELPIFGLAIILAFLGALAVTFLVPRFIGIYIVAAVALIYIANPSAISVGPTLTVLLLGTALLGTIYLVQKNK